PLSLTRVSSSPRRLDNSRTACRTWIFLAGGLCLLRQLRQALPRRRNPLYEVSLLLPILLRRNKICGERLLFTIGIELPSQRDEIVFVTVDFFLPDGPAKALLEGKFQINRSTVLSSSDLEGVALRYGFFYGPGTWFTPDGDVANQVRDRKLAIA